MAQIDDTALAQLQSMAGAFNVLVSDPNHGMEVKKIIKQINPSVYIPEIDAAAPHVHRIDQISAQLEAMKQERVDREATEKLDRELAAARQKFGLTDEGMAAVEKLMLEDGIASPMSAAELLDSRKKREARSAPPSPKPRNLGRDIDADRKANEAWYSDPLGTAERELFDGLSKLEQKQQELMEG